MLPHTCWADSRSWDGWRFPCIPLGAVGAKHSAASHRTTAVVHGGSLQPGYVWGPGDESKVWGVPLHVQGMISLGMISCPILVHAHCSPCEPTRSFQVPSAQFWVASLLGSPRRLFTPTLWVRRPPLGVQPLSAIPSPLIPVLSHPSLSRTPQFLVRPHKGDIATLPVPAPQKHLPLPAPLCPTLPKPFLTERWDFWELFGGFGFFFSPLLNPGICTWVSWRKERAGAGH